MKPIERKRPNPSRWWVRIASLIAGLIVGSSVVGLISALTH